MQRWISILLGLAVVALAVFLTWKGLGPSRVVPAVADGGAVDAGAPKDGGAAATASPDLVGDADTFLPFVGSYDTRTDGGIGFTMPDGTPVPPLPAEAPRQVKLGVILLQYQGAQLAPPTARSKADAKALADKIDQEAKNDFHAAVQKGDSGFSFDEAGVIYRGSLEPAIEYRVWTLEVGKVSDPIDTPRGYWIVKRIE